MTSFLCDSNVWLALALSDHVKHGAAAAWLTKVADPGSVIFCRVTQQSLLRLLTSKAVLVPYGNPPLNNEEAWRVYESFVGDERIALETDEPMGIEAQWKRFALRNAPSPKLWMDAYLAAFALRAGHLMVTTDGGYRQFDGLDLLVL